MKKLTVGITLVSVFFCSGCKVAGVAGIMSSPLRHEKKVPAELSFARPKNQRILVLVNQPYWLNCPENLRFHLTEVINKRLMKKVKLPNENLISYDELSRFRSENDNFSLLTPADVGEALNVDMVLFVVIEDYQLKEIAETGYHKGSLSGQAVVFDAADKEKLWPESEKSRSIRVGFEVESGGREVAVARLAGAFAHCTVRYFYNCPRDNFKIADDKSNVAWQNWDSY